jgi:hypothetical protein
MFGDLCRERFHAGDASNRFKPRDALGGPLGRVR